ncbi:allantoicase [Panaeolus papilionaceus]|nr:allantoicase [Panaeolus papilionaceus]
MTAERIALEDFNQHFSSYTELSSVALGGRIIDVSDEFFAEAFHLLLVEPAPSMKGQFGPNGALFSGWETRRHNPTFDWCMIQLGTTGTLCGFDVDTANFNGNEAPEVSIYALHDPELKDPTHDDPRWTEVLPRSNLGPSSRHLFKIPETTSYNYVKIHMYPDGGIARFRAYGEVSPVHPTSDVAFDLAHVFAGGRVLAVSDQHFGVGSNLILPGRGKNMGDGWETKRSRTKGHNDWVIIQLGAPGHLEQVEIDTNHFLGNFPESCEIHAIRDTGDIDWSSSSAIPDNSHWTLVLPRTKLTAHKQHYFELENVEDRVFTHIKVTIHPDGGMKRVRIIGRKATQDPSVVASESNMSDTSLNKTRPSARSISRASTRSTNITTFPVEPLTSEAFQPFGQVIQAYNPSSAASSSLKVTPANGGTASKFHKLSLLSSSYPENSGATTGISVYRCQPLKDIVNGVTVLRTLERHSYTSQAFIPMGAGTGDGIEDPSGRYLVVVAQNGVDDKPAMQTLKAFVATTAQGISYNAGIWHQPMTVLDKSLDLACVETQIGDGSKADCEILDLESTCILQL